MTCIHKYSSKHKSHCTQNSFEHFVIFMRAKQQLVETHYGCFFESQNGSRYSKEILLLYRFKTSIMSSRAKTMSLKIIFSLSLSKIKYILCLLNFICIPTSEKNYLSRMIYPLKEQFGLFGTINY